MIGKWSVSTGRVARAIGTAAVVAAVCTFAGRVHAAPPSRRVALAATASATAPDPVIAADGFATFTVTAAAATTVNVTGSWGLSYTNVAYPLTKSGDTWTAFLGPLTPGLYSYTLVIDGVATKDPNNASVVHSSPALSTFFVPGRSADFLAVHRGDRGTLSTLNYHSDVTGTDRHATVWTPPGYTAARRSSYPTFYLVHGGGGDYLDWVQQGRADVILDSLFRAHRLEPMVVVMVDGNVPGSLGPPESDEFVPEVLDNLLPAVQNAYNVSHSASRRALAGLSLGGLQAFNTVLLRPGAFRYVGDFSSGYFPAVIDDLQTQDIGLMTNPAINAKTRLFRIYIGNRADIAYENNIATRALFTKFDIDFQFAGSYPLSGHVWKTWQHDLFDFAPRLFHGPSDR